MGGESEKDFITFNAASGCQKFPHVVRIAPSLSLLRTTIEGNRETVGHAASAYTGL